MSIKKRSPASGQHGGSFREKIRPKKGKTSKDQRRRPTYTREDRIRELNSRKGKLRSSTEDSTMPGTNRSIAFLEGPQSEHLKGVSAYLTFGEENGPVLNADS